MSIGLTPRKSLTLDQIKIPEEFYFDFLRGCIDGDGSILVSKHPESKLHQLRLVLCSGSIRFLEWIHATNTEMGEIDGGRFYKSTSSSVYTLSYGKHDSIKLLRKMYHDENVPHLTRKKEILNKLPEWRNSIRASFRN